MFVKTNVPNKPVIFTFTRKFVTTFAFIVVVLIVPSCSVTWTIIVFEPDDKVILPDALPDVTLIPFTVIVAKGSDAVGVTVIEVVPLLSVTK